MSPDELVCCRDGCGNFIAEDSVDVPIRSPPAYFRCSHCVVLAPRCSRALWHNLQPTSDRCVIFASNLATKMIPAIAIISQARLLCFQGTCGLFKYFFKNALFSVCRNMKSTVHVLYAGWLTLSLFFLFVCLFVGINPEKLYTSFCVGREVNLLGVVTHG